jgi:hypothetical protein
MSVDIIPNGVLVVIEIPTCKCLTSHLVFWEHLVHTFIFLKLDDYITPVSSYKPSPELVTQNVNIIFLRHLHIVIVYFKTMVVSNLHNLLS